MTCPDPRGPLIEREDFLEGSIDALREILEKYAEHVGELRDANAEAVVMLAATEPRNEIEEYAEALDTGTGLLGTVIREALQQARWKLERVQKAEAAR
jgi:hypothetical protein